MTIRSISSRGDPRVVCGLLAKEVLTTLEAQRLEAEDEFLINLIRLLDMYRYGTFKTRHPRGVLDRRPIKKRNLLKRPDSMPRVQESLRAAHHAVFGVQKTEDEVSVLLTDILEKCRPNAPKEPTQEELISIRNFLEAFLHNLEEPQRGE